jgi:Rap1a immunity proteins
VFFGPHGSLIIEVLEAALRIDRSTAGALSRGRHPDAPAAYDRAWRAWLEQKGISDNYQMSCDRALSIGTQGSPIGDGLTLIFSTAFNRAKAVDGDAAIDSDDEEVWLKEPWHGAASVLGDTALALGAPELLIDSDHACLMAGWGALPR